MRKKTIIQITLLGVILASLGLVTVGVVLWNRPLGPGLGLSVANSGQDAPATGDTTGGSNPAQSVISKFLSVFKNTDSSGDTACGGPSVMTILLIGSDERGQDYLYGLADSIRIVRVDFTNASVMAVDIPRDLWVEIPDISDHFGITAGKLNQAYFFGNPGMGYYDGPGQGPGLLARTLELNFGLQVDHYLAVDMQTFTGVIDAVGGIDVHLDTDVNLNVEATSADTDQILPAGDHHLDGQAALALARSRNPTIFQRARYQDIVLRALEDKLLSPAIIPQLPGLISQFSNSVQTDLSPKDISQLLCLSKRLSKDSTQMLEFPDDMFTGGSTYDPYRQVNTYTLSADINLIRQYFNDFMNGVWP